MRWRTVPVDGHHASSSRPHRSGANDPRQFLLRGTGAVGVDILLGTVRRLRQRGTCRAGWPRVTKARCASLVLLSTPRQLHAEKRLLPLAGLVHLGIGLTLGVLGRWRIGARRVVERAPARPFRRCPVPPGGSGAQAQGAPMKSNPAIELNGLPMTELPRLETHGLRAKSGRQRQMPNVRLRTEAMGLVE